MKIGTDGVLLGAWTNLDRNPNSILDIGAGTGIISLQLAQRSTAETIDAIEIDADAYEQCTENFEASPWGDRLFCYHAGLDELVEDIEMLYDLIVSNPPYFEPSSPDSKTKARTQARRYDSLPFEELLAGVSLLLSPEGSFATIIPYAEESRFLEIASTLGLYQRRITRVQGTVKSPIKRSLLQLDRSKDEYKSNSLIIEKSRHVYTEEYISLTKDFYLKM